MMIDKCRFIIGLAVRYKLYAEQSAELFSAINSLPKSEISKILTEYVNSETVRKHFAVRNGGRVEAR